VTAPATVRGTLFCISLKKIITGKLGRRQSADELKSGDLPYADHLPLSVGEKASDKKRILVYAYFSFAYFESPSCDSFFV
jgi:hypothetical protein